MEYADQYCGVEIFHRDFAIAFEKVTGLGFVNCEWHAEHQINVEGGEPRYVGAAPLPRRPS